MPKVKRVRSYEYVQPEQGPLHLRQFKRRRDGYKCPLCGAARSSWSAVKQHMKWAHDLD